MRANLFRAQIPCTLDPSRENAFLSKCQTMMPLSRWHFAFFLVIFYDEHQCFVNEEINPKPVEIHNLVVRLENLHRFMSSQTNPVRRIECSEVVGYLHIDFLLL